MLHPYPPYVTGSPGFLGTVQQEFNLLTWKRHSQNFSGPGTRLLEKRPFGRKRRFKWQAR